MSFAGEGRLAAAMLPQRTLFDEAVTLHLAGDVAAAAQVYQAFLKNEPRHFGALWNFGRLHFDAGQRVLAVKLFRKAARSNPASAEVRRDLGHALIATGDLRRAGMAFREVVRLNSDVAEYHLEFASVLHSLNRNEQAIAHYRRAIWLKPDYAEAYNDLGVILQDLQRFDEALTAFTHAVAFNPKSAAAQNNFGNILREDGQLSAAGAAYEAAVALEPRNGAYRRNLAESKTFANDDPYIAQLADLASRPDGLQLRDRMEIHFALGKVYSDTGEFSRALEHMIEANRLKRSQIVYDEKSALEDLADISTCFTPDLMNVFAGVGTTSAMPIFVVGMPRAGTTLVAQILGSHSEVFGAGEPSYFGNAVASVTKGHGVSMSKLESQLTKASLHKIGARYLSALAALSSGRPRVVDKLPLNFRYIGLINLIFPNAPIIHVRRDPLDTCLSCFSKHFIGEHPYAYDLGELGRYYRAYEDVMMHWRKVLPPGRMLEVNYEELVADLEGNARRMLAYCGLVWAPACLRFHEARQWVRSASAVQVRQPLYRTAVGRASSYDQLKLIPLLEGLGNIAHTESG